MIKQILNMSRRTALRFFLAYTAFGWGICLAGVFTPATTAFDLLQYVGGVDPTPMLGSLEAGRRPMLSRRRSTSSV